MEWSTETWSHIRKQLELQAPGMTSRWPNGYRHEDLVSEAMERLLKYEQDREFESLRDALAYLSRIMRNRLNDLTWIPKKAVELLPKEAGYLERSFADESLSDIDAKLDIEQAFEGLSEQDHEGMYLRFVLGWKQKEIAEHWGVSVQAVSKRLRKLGEKLEIHLNS